MPAVFRPIPGRNSAPGSGGNRPPGQGGNRPPGWVPPSGVPTWTPTRSVLPVPAPDPLPIAPLLDWRWAAGLAAGALLSEWGRINAPRLEVPKDEPYTYNVVGTYEIHFSRLSAISGTTCAGHENYSDSWSSADVIHFGYTNSPVSSVTISATKLNSRQFCISDDGPPQYGIHGSVTVAATGQSSPFSLEPIPEWQRSFLDGVKTVEIAITAVLVNGVPQELPPTTRPVQRPKVPIVPTVLPQQAPDALPERSRPQPLPAPFPLPSPGVVPAEPGPAIAPSVPIRTINWNWSSTAIGSPLGMDGRVVESSPAPVPQTRPDAIYPVPGAPPVVGNGPRPTPTGISQELGRIEQKLHSLLNPLDTVPDWIQLLRDLYELFSSVTNGTTYTLTEYCNPTGDPYYEPPHWDFEAAGALSFPGVVINRLDALAAMVDKTVRVQQQVCMPTPARAQVQGQPVTVNFIANTKPEGSSAYLRKTMTYRDQTGTKEEDHVSHWADFVWYAGPVIVTSHGMPWGVVQVWAESEAEGKRVIGHAAAIAGIDVNSQQHRWEVSSPRSRRYGKAGTMSVERDMTGTPCVSKRAGASGRPDWALDL